MYGVAERKRKKEATSRTKRKKIIACGFSFLSDDKTSDALAPAAFYMTLPLSKAKQSGRPESLWKAIELAKEFWGWPDEYKRNVSPRAGKERVYWNWKPIWRVWSVQTRKYEISVREVKDVHV